MKVLAFSDTHFGVLGSSADDFGGVNRQNILSLLIDCYKSTGHKIIAVGDIFELWQFSLGDIIESRPQIERIVSSIDCIVRGNHDSSLPDSICGTPVVDSLQMGSTLFIHGHQFDPWNHGPLNLVGKTLSKMGAYGEVYVHRSLDDWFTSAAYKLQEIFTLGRYGKQEEYEEKVKSYVEEQVLVDTVVFGHTHQVSINPPIFYNTGSWVGDNYDSVSLEVNNG